MSAIFSREFDTVPPDSSSLRERFDSLITGLETVGFDLEQRLGTAGLPAGSKSAWEELIWPAYRLRRALIESSQPSSAEANSLDRYFLEALAGILANRQPELRLRLQNVPLETAPDFENQWDLFLEDEVKRAFLLLVRKARGTGDITDSQRTIQRLRELQERGERTLLEGSIPAEARIVALRTVALYNCAKAVELASEFVLSGPGTRGVSDRGVEIEIDRFIANARQVLAGLGTDLLGQVVRLGQACRAIVNSSVHAGTLPRTVREFVNIMASNTHKPLLEFWYAQRFAIDSRLLDPTRVAVVVSMPTSAGKTLLAELAIVQTRHDSPGTHMAYIAPTRALVTQASLGLRRDLQSQNFRVKVATPGFELSPVEDAVLTDDYDILVTTPEKLDLLVRLGHPSVQQLSLVVVDEAHNLADEERGTRIELLLSTLRRERPNCRFLLLTPFARNAPDLARWLGANQGASIVLDWKPNDKVVGAFTIRRSRDRTNHLFYGSLNSIHSDCPAGVEVDAGRLATGLGNTKTDIAIASTVRWAAVKKGGVLLLAESPKAAQNRANSIAELRSDAHSSRPIDIVCRFLDADVGTAHPLSTLLRKRIAFHHAGLSAEARYLVERLVEEKEISVLCATTTLAQGVHFPLSAAVIESFERRRTVRGRWRTEEMKPAEFWNIAGRVGRTLEDALGSVGFAARNVEDIRKIQAFLDKDSSLVSSALIETLRALRGRNVTFGTDLVERYRPMSAFLQYIVHAIALGGPRALTGDAIEDLLRGSFAFSEAQRESQELADEMVRLAREYVDQLSNDKGNSLGGFARLADGTGFSSVSVDLVLSEWRAGAPSERDFSPNALFPREGGPSSTLTRAIETLARVPELRLGSYEVGEFSPGRVARITTAWVNNASLAEIAANEYRGDILDCTRHVNQVVSSLVPWGLRAIEKVRFSGIDGVEWETLDLIPAMVLHGVRTREAVALRMLGVPRFAAEGLASVSRAEATPIGQLSSWLNESSSRLWHEAIPRDFALSGEECKLVWQIMTGQAAWAELE